MGTFEKQMAERSRHELAEVNRWIEALMQEPKSQELESGGDNTPLSEGVDSVQAEAQERARSELLGRLIERAAKLERALQHLEAGVYGFCNLCRKPIHRQRLEAIPEAAFCLECKTRLEAAVATRQPEEVIP